jgi:hypothetical protein
MADRTESITKVAQADIVSVEAFFRVQVPRPTTVTWEPDGDGTYTVTATWGDTHGAGDDDNK